MTAFMNQCEGLLNIYQTILPPLPAYVRDTADIFNTIEQLERHRQIFIYLFIYCSIHHRCLVTVIQQNTIRPRNSHFSSYAVVYLDE